MLNKFQQLVNQILEDVNASGMPGGVWGDGPGNVATDPNIYAAMSIAGPAVLMGPKKRKKKKKKSKFPMYRRKLPKKEL